MKPLDYDPPGTEHVDPAPPPSLPALRRRRRAVYVVTALAMFPVVVVLVLWAQSELSPQVWLWPFGSSWQLESADAVLVVVRQVPAPAGPFPTGGAYQSYDLPYWLLLGAASVVAAVPAAAAVSTGRRVRRARLGRCRACDYDLTGNLSGVCPECGRPGP